MVLYELFDFVHFLGLAFGLGGATIATIISAKAAKDKDVRKAAEKILPSISKLIMAGLLLLIISGIALPFFMKWPMNKPLLIIKHVLVVWMVIFGVMIGTRIRKKKPIKALSIINLILWYAVTLMSAFV